MYVQFEHQGEDKLSRFHSFSRFALFLPIYAERNFLCLKKILLASGHGCVGLTLIHMLQRVHTVHVAQR